MGPIRSYAGVRHALCRDSSGHVRPFAPVGDTGEVLCTPYVLDWADFTGEFGGTAARNALISGLQTWSQSLSRTPWRPLALWIGGSFIDPIDAPGDIDILVHFQHTKGPANSAALDKDRLRWPEALDRTVIAQRFGLDTTFLVEGEHPVGQTFLLAGWLMTHTCRTPDQNAWRGVVCLSPFSNNAPGRPS